MANREQLAILHRGVDYWNSWRLQHYDVLIDLRDANLRDIDISQALLNGADLRDTDLQNAQLQQSDLRFADLSRANLAATDLSHAKVGWTTFGNVNLSQAAGLETIRHLGPSTIGIDTIVTSQRQIPEAFLLGAGVPQEIIPTLDTQLYQRPDEFFSCFISHATADTAFVEKLYQDLQREQVRCWFAPADLQGGEMLHDQLRRAIQTHDKLLLILSASSINSQWVETEIWEARQQEIVTGQRKLFPVSLIDYATLRSWRCFDGDTGRDLAREVRGYFIPDFSQWQDNRTYRQALHKLIMALKR